MNVAELITRLQELDPSLRVVVRGYEGGLNDVHVGEPFDLALFVNDEWHYGDHEAIQDYNKEKLSKFEAVKAVEL